MGVDVLTKCIHLENEDKNSPYGAVSFPIFQTATFAHPGVENSTGYDYSRLQNPTREQLEKVVASLENGIDALAFSSGMAAIATLMELFKSGDHLIVDADLYGGTIRLFDHISEKNGLKITKIDCIEVEIERNIRENTKAVYIETPTNPMMNVYDIKRLAELTHAHGALLIVDNTFLSPYFQNPLDLGADIVVHSGTKYLGGHNDTLSGFLVAGEEKAQENAFEIVRYLSEQKEVTKVLYPGLKEHPGYEIMKKQSRGFGGMVTFEVESEAFAKSILGNVKLIQFAESLGGVETLITYPVTQTHADVPKDQLEKNGINERLLRLSVGIEAANDLILEFERVFEIARRERDGREKS